MLCKHYIAERRRGIAAVELAVVLPFLMFITLVTVDFGRFAKTSITVSNAARNGALYASSWSSQKTTSNATDANGIRQAVLDDILNNLEGVQDSDVTVTSTPGTDAENYNTVTVKVSLQFKFLFSFNFGGIFNYQGNPTITDLCQMRVRVAQ